MGRVDGKGGRGSYSGLEDALQGLLDTIAGTSAGTNNPSGPAPTAASAGPSFLLTCLTVGEEVLCYESSGTAAVAKAVATAGIAPLHHSASLS